MSFEVGSLVRTRGRDWMVLPGKTETLREAIDAIDSHIGDGDAVYVHCWGGIDRTGLLAGCWLAEHGYPGRKALVQLRQLWRSCPKSALKDSPETPEQEKYIINWRHS